MFRIHSVSFIVIVSLRRAGGSTIVIAIALIGMLLEHIGSGNVCLLLTCTMSHSKLRHLRRDVRH